MLAYSIMLVPVHVQQENMETMTLYSCCIGISGWSTSELVCSV